ncbi:threonine/serine exporter family protein [Lactiplantibacillus plantarum]|uniref:threonine/serine exporter family protein n=1 Tax=Lactiplantibacillus plantarum TaxID=1590 RepID=UPI00358DAC45
MLHWLLTTGLAQGILAYLATASFGVLLNIPRRAVNLSGWVGAAGWFTYEVLYHILPLGIDAKLAIDNLNASYRDWRRASGMAAHTNECR